MHVYLISVFFFSFVPKFFVESVLYHSASSTCFETICETWKIIKILSLLCKVILVAKWKRQESFNEWMCTVPNRIVVFWQIFFFFCYIIFSPEIFTAVSWTRLLWMFILTLFCLFKDLQCVNSSWRSNFWPVSWQRRCRGKTDCIVSRNQH